MLLANWARLVKFSHTIFALPFALAMLVVVSRTYPISLVQVGLLMVCLVAARTAAMAFNRILDRRIDALNPRTAQRELPSGKVSLASAYSLLLVASIAFLLGSWGLGVHCLVLAPPVLGVLFFYSWTKRFTSGAHLVLGLALALAPGGVWYALTAEFAWLPVWMMLGVLLWVAGFDIIYSCQDAEFDRHQKLYSIPARLGVPAALKLAALLHIISALCFLWFWSAANLGSAALLGTAVFIAIVLSQHRLVRADDLSRVNEAFFTRNGFASVIYLIGAVIDRLLS